MKPNRLTPADRRALQYLARVNWATAAQLGQVLRLDRTDRVDPAALQKSGRKMAHRLERMGYAKPAHRIKFPAYMIAPRGRHALTAAGAHLDVRR